MELLNGNVYISTNHYYRFCSGGFRGQWQLVEESDNWVGKLVYNVSNFEFAKSITL